MLVVAAVHEHRRLPFDLDIYRTESSDMIEMVNQPRSDVPAITHVDYSARLQTVHPDDNEVLYDLLSQFDDLTGCPVIINTSFNVRGEPIVMTPEDAIRCFFRTEMDLLVLENSLIWKNKQTKRLQDRSWEEEFELD